jgi:putative transcriptional regulator
MKKGKSTKMQVLVEVAALQPKIRQKEVAERVGVTPQAVSEYLKDLVTDGFVKYTKRGQYEVTKAGIELIIEWTNELNNYIRYITEDIVGKVTVWTAIAEEDVGNGTSVGLRMRDGILYAFHSNSKAFGARGTTIGDARKGDDVGVEHLSGIIPMERVHVTIAIVPRVQRGGSAAVDLEALRQIVDNKPVAVLGLEALVSVKKVGISPLIQFAAAEGVIEAAFRGLSTVVVAVDEAVPPLIAELMSRDISYESVDLSIGPQ